MAKQKRQDSVTVWRGSAGDWWWTRHSPNGRVVGASSEGYISKKRCFENARRNMTECKIELVPTEGKA